MLFYIPYGCEKFKSKGTAKRAITARVAKNIIESRLWAKTWTPNKSWSLISAGLSLTQ